MPHQLPKEDPPHESATSIKPLGPYGEAPDSQSGDSEFDSRQGYQTLVPFENGRQDVMRCPKCETDKPSSEFNLNQKWCRACKQEYQRRYYKENRSEYIATVMKSRQSRKEKAYEFIHDHFSRHPCVDCGEADYRCLHFDHVRGKKTANVSTLIAGGFSMERLQTEISKCEVRCANCHSKVTAERAGWYAWLKS